MRDVIEYKEIVRTGPLVKFLIGQDDQCACEMDIAEEFHVGTNAVREALARLKKVNRVEEIVRTVWHLI